MNLSLRVSVALLALFDASSMRGAAGEIQSAARGDSPAPSVLREESQGYSFERPLIWRLEGVPGGFFIRSPEFGGAIIMGHQAAAPAAPGDLEARIVAGLGSMLNVRDPVIVGKAALAIGERPGVRLRYRSGTIGGGPADGVISVDGDRARAEYFHAGQRVPYPVEFIRENDRWKVDLLPFMKYGGEALRAQIERDGQPEDEVLLTFLAKASRRKPAPTIWSPTE